MQLDLSDDERSLATTAYVAFSRGESAPQTSGTITELALIAQQLGAAAVPSRFHSDVLAGLCGWSGSQRVAVALSILDGVADFVAHVDDAEVVIARTGPSSIAQIEIDRCRVMPQPSIDLDGRWRIVLPDETSSLSWDVDDAVARAAIVRAADAVGAARAALDATVEHVQKRIQWGNPLSALQVVQHRCADMLLDITVASDAVFDAAGVADRGAEAAHLRLASAIAQATAIERSRRVTAAAHQLAGGSGIYAEAPFHRWYRRTKVAEAELGDLRSHRETIATSILGQKPASR